MKKISASSVLTRILASDKYVTLKSIGRFFPRVHKEIRKLCSFCEKVWPHNYTVFISGSLALSLRSNNEQVAWSKDNKSDVDIWLIVSGKANTNTLSLSEKNSVINLDRYDMVALPWVSPIRISIKMFSDKTASKVFSLRNTTHRVLRVKSLKSTKPSDYFYGLSAAYYQPTIEKKTGGLYEMFWVSKIFRNNDIVLTDLLAAGITGYSIVDNLKIFKIRKQFIKNLAKKLKSHPDNKSYDSSYRFYNYFFNRFRHSFEKILRS